MYKNQVTGTILRVETISHTGNGNPIKKVAVEVSENRVNPDTDVLYAEDVVIFRISNDSSLVYQIGNGEFRDQPHTFELTRAGRISGRYEKA